MRINVRRALKDFPYYAEKVLRIKDKTAKLIPLKLNRPQRRLWAAIKDKLDAGEPVRFDLLKARQMGFSTFVQGLLYWVTTTRKFRTSLVVSHEEGSAGNLFNKSEVFLNFSPDAFRPMTRQANRNELYFANPKRKAAKQDPGLESRISVKTANNKHLAASLTLDFIHFSEIARYEDLLADVDASMISVLQTMAYEPWTFIFRETTAQGMGWYKDLWDNSDDGYTKFFASWVAEDAYTSAEPMDAEALDINPDGKWGHERQVFDTVMAELELWYPELTDEAQRTTEALKRMAWRRRMISANFGGKLLLFQQEYPLTADEAFITSGNTVFDTKKIADIQWALKSTDGQMGGMKYPPTAFRYSHDEDGFYSAPFGPLRVYTGPAEKGLYVIGGDVSEGISRNADESTLQVIKLPEMLQVATFQARVRPDDLADIAAALGRLYNWALVAIENNGPGVATNLRLSQVLFYPNLYRREIFDGEERKFTTKIGWQTNRASKPVMITALREALDEDLLLFRDLNTLAQMLVYVQHKDGTMGAVQGKMDDLVISLAVSLQAAFQQGVVGTESRRNVTTEGTMEWYLNRSAVENADADIIGYRDFGELGI